IRARHVTHITSQRWISREFGVRQTRAAKNNLVGAHLGWRRKERGARGADDVVLVNPITAYTDRANEIRALVEREAAWKNRDAVRQIRVGRAGRCGAVERIGSGEIGNNFLHAEQRSWLRSNDAGRVERLREKADGSR